MNRAGLLLSLALLCAALWCGACREQPTIPPKPLPTAPVSAESAPAALPRPAHVILVSFDGTRPDSAQQAAMPTLQAMAREGAVTWTARSIVPPLTLPAHTSMLTGLAPEEHNVYWNEWIPAFGTLRVPTVFSLATTGGVSTAVFSGKDKLAYLFPTGAVHHLSYPVPTLDPTDFRRTNHFQNARTVAARAVEHFAARKPRLMFVHFLDADLAGHFNGWPSPEYLAALADCDAALATLRAGVEKAGATNVTFLLTADHGGNGLSHGVDRPEDMTIPWIAWGAGVRRGHALTNAVNMVDTAATLAWLLDLRLPPNATGQPVREAFLW